MALACCAQALPRKVTTFDDDAASKEARVLPIDPALGYYKEADGSWVGFNGLGESFHTRHAAGEACACVERWEEDTGGGHFATAVVLLLKHSGIEATSSPCRSCS